jgi:hypothetical protein
MRCGDSAAAPHPMSVMCRKDKPELAANPGNCRKTAQQGSTQHFGYPSGRKVESFYNFMGLMVAEEEHLRSE